MPLRKLHRQDSEACLDLFNWQDPIGIKTNNFDKSFNPDNAPEQFSDWVRWDDATTVPEPPILGRPNSLASSITRGDTGGATSPIYPTPNGFVFQFDPFDFETESQPYPGAQHGPEAESFPADIQSRQEDQQSLYGYSTLTKVEVQKLHAIAMPGKLLAQVVVPFKPSSPTISSSSTSDFPNRKPQTRTAMNKKQKSGIKKEGVSSALCESRKRGHNAIEKRYRTNLNEKINCLRKGLPPLNRKFGSDSQHGHNDEDWLAEEMDSKSESHKTGKAAILIRALEYIHHLESTSQKLGTDVAVLKGRIKTLENLAVGRSIIIDGIVMAPTMPLPARTETIESIQAEFKQTKRKSTA